MSAARLSPDSKPFCEIYKDGVETIHHEAQGKTKRLDKIYEFMKKAIMIIRPRRYITVQGDLNFFWSIDWISGFPGADVVLPASTNH